MTNLDRFDSLIFERKAIDGNAFLTQTIKNYPDFTNISGPNLIDKVEAQARTYSAEIKTVIDVASIEQKEHKIYVNFKHETFVGRSVVASTDQNYRMLGIPGEDDLKLWRSFLCNLRWSFLQSSGSGGNSALEEGIFLSNFVKKVRIVNRAEEFSASSTYVEKLASIDNMETYRDKEVIEFVADEDG